MIILENPQKRVFLALQLAECYSYTFQQQKATCLGKTAKTREEF